MRIKTNHGNDNYKGFSLEVDRNNEKLWERFLSKVIFGLEDTDCWIWKGSKSTGNALTYGNFSYQGRPIKAHRMSYALHKGPIPKGYQINHSCDNPLCVNPEHLHLGTVQTNWEETFARNRFPNCERHSRAKLSNDNVRLIFALKGHVAQKQIARMFNVSESCISAILNNRTWTKLDN